jgi:hypothetical protein
MADLWLHPGSPAEVSLRLRTGNPRATSRDAVSLKEPHPVACALDLGTPLELLAADSLDRSSWRKSLHHRATLNFR